MTLLGFPAQPLPIRAEMLISGTWTDITSRIRLANEIVISGRGRQNEQGRPGVCTCSFTLNNRDGYFSTRAPNSVNFGKLGKNTPFRVSVTEDSSFAIIGSAEASRVRTVDKASIDVVGDIDVRVEFEPDNWTSTDLGMVLAAKYRRTASANRSWALTVNRFGYPQFWWSTDGAISNTLTSTVPLPTQVGPIAMRFTLDVDNGAAGKTYTFYTSDTIGGTWTVLGSATVSSGITSIFNSTADIELGRLDDGRSSGLSNIGGFYGRMYAFELRNGIAGTIVAQASITAQPRGTTSWSDGLASPNTWLVDTTAEITPDNRRFYGEMSSLPQQWDISGKDIFVPAQAADVTRRLQQGGTPVISAWRRYWQGKVAQGFSTTGVTGYWSFEDGSTATQASNGVPRGAPATTTNGTFGAPGDLLASSGAITLTDTNTRIYGQTRRTAVTLNNNSFVNFAFKMSAIPSASTTLFDFPCLGDIGRLNISVTATQYNVAIYDPDGALIATQGTTFGAATNAPNLWQIMRIQLTQNVAQGRVDVGWYHPGDTTPVGMTTLTFTGLAGIFTGFTVKGTSGNVGTQYAHLAIGNYFLDNTTYDYILVAKAFDGETTGQRWVRALAEAGITGAIVGVESGERMGPQPQVGIMDVLYEIADVEQGQVYPDRNSAALLLRSRRSVLNQYGPSITYSAGELGNMVPLPTDDDLLLRNLVTATRGSGSNATSEVTTGPNGTASPLATPPGAGVYNTSINRNVYTDDRLQDMAAWEAALGTVDEPRWPQVRVDLERSPYTGTVAKVRKGHILASLDIGDLFTLTGLVQANLAPDDAALMVQGLTETLGNRKWWLLWNTSPYTPYIANDLTALSRSRNRLAASNSTVAAGFTTTALSFTVSTPTGRLWGTTLTKPGNFPQNVIVGGEVITVSGIVGTGTTQTFTASARSVNGIVKAHVTGETVQVQYPFRTGL